MKKTISALILCGAVAGPSALAVPTDRGILQGKIRGTLVVLDVSGSMSGSPLAGAKRTLSRALSTYSSSAAAGLISFSGCASSDIRLNVPLAVGAAPQVISQSRTLQAGGGTDIYNALLKAEAEIQGFRRDSCVQVLLLSDGGHGCTYDDPETVARRIAENYGDCNQIDTISIGVPEWEADTFERITEAGRGSYRSVSDETELEEAIRESLDQFQEDERSRNDWRGDYSGGDRRDGDENGVDRRRRDGNESDPDGEERERLGQGQENERERGR